MLELVLSPDAAAAVKADAHSQTLELAQTSAELVASCFRTTPDNESQEDEHPHQNLKTVWGYWNDVFVFGFLFVSYA